MGEAAHRRDGLLGEIELGGGVLVLDGAVGLARRLADPVDLLVRLRAVEVTLLTSARDRPADRGRVPGANAPDLAEATMRLLGQLRHVPARDHALETVTWTRAVLQTLHGGNMCVKPLV